MLLANSGVIIGIFFLIVEIRQNDQMLLEDQQLRQATAFREIESEFLQSDRQLTSDPYLAQLIDRAREGTSKFNGAELIMLANYEGQQARIFHIAYRFWVAGHLPESAWEAIERGVERRKGSNTLMSKIFMGEFMRMPDDIKEHFNIQEYPEELYNISSFRE